MIERFRFLKVLPFSVILFLCFSLGFNILVLGDEVSRIKFLYPPMKVQVDGRVYQLGYVREGEEKFLVALDSKGKIVEDSKILEKVFFVDYVYRPVFHKPREFNGPVDINGYKRLEEYRFMQQLADWTLFIREAATRALVQAGKIYITGGASSGTMIIEKISEKTALHVVDNIIKNPANYLKGIGSIYFEESVVRWKKAEALYLKTTKNHVLTYEDARQIHEDLSFSRSYGTESMLFLARLTLSEGGGGDLISQLTKIGEYSAKEIVAEGKDFIKSKTGKVPTEIEANILAERVFKVIGKSSPIFQDYVQRVKSFYDYLHDYKESEYWKYYSAEHIARSIKLAKMIEEQQKGESKPIPSGAVITIGETISENLQAKLERFIEEQEKSEEIAKEKAIKTFEEKQRQKTVSSQKYTESLSQFEEQKRADEEKRRTIIIALNREEQRLAEEHWRRNLEENLQLQRPYERNLKQSKQDRLSYQSKFVKEKGQTEAISRTTDLRIWSNRQNIYVAEIIKSGITPSITIFIEATSSGEGVLLFDEDLFMTNATLGTLSLVPGNIYKYDIPSSTLNPLIQKFTSQLPKSGQDNEKRIEELIEQAKKNRDLVTQKNWLKKEERNAEIAYWDNYIKELQRQRDEWRSLSATFSTRIAKFRFKVMMHAQGKKTESSTEIRVYY